MDREIKNIQHADDLTVALWDEISLKNAIDTIQEFCAHAGSKINVNVMLTIGQKFTMTCRNYLSRGKEEN